MKKSLLVTLFMILGLTGVQSQNVKIGVMGGISGGDAAAVSTFVLGADAYYYFTNIDSFIEIGATAGFRNYLGDEVLGVPLNDAQFLPLAASARLKILEVFSGGADVGYAVGITDGLDGGVYFRPILGIDILNSLEVNLSYEYITDSNAWASVNLGILFQL
jgi:hypothetical protein